MLLTTQLLLSGVLSAFLCLLCITLLLSLAVPLGLVDRPDERKRHVGDIPAIGGLAVYLSVFLCVFLTNSGTFSYTPLLIGGVLVVTGVLDDRYDLSALLRLPIQALSAVLMMYIGGVGIESIGSIWGAQEVVFTGLTAIVFTIVCTVGVINSINMIDGIDGLSGSIIFVTFLPLAYLSWIADERNLLVLLISFLGAILAFLFFNARVFRSAATLFLGDTGSMLFGFVLVWALITLTQGPEAVLSPVAAGWIFGLPLIDTIAVMVGRLLDKRSPFDADRTHLHYRLMDAGLSVNQTVGLITLIHLVFIVIGLLANAVTFYEPALFWFFTSLVVLHYFLTDRIIEALFEGAEGADISV